MLAAPPFNFLETLDAVDDAIEKNAEIAEAFVASGVALYGLRRPSTLDQQDGSEERSEPKPSWQGPINSNDQQKAHSTIKQLFRDWSAEGNAEREACYGRVLQALDAEFSNVPMSKKGVIRVLVPGAGLGRFVFEVSRAGYAVEGNEISYHQLIASNFMLNFTTHAKQFELYPWISTFSNHRSREQHLQKYLVPDIHPGTELEKVAGESDIHPFERMSFSSADFCISYKEPHNLDSFDAVTSIFFIDTAPNVIKYVETVHACLKTGGLWINLGPLKWHFENTPPGGSKSNGAAQVNDNASKDTADGGIGDPGSVELTEDEVVVLVEKMGFSIEKHVVQESETGYIGDPNSMWQSIYWPTFWVARKT